MVAGEAHRGRLGLFGDMLYARLSTDGQLAETDIGIEIAGDTLMLTTGGAYRLVSRERSWLDLRGGLRVWSVSSELTVDPVRLEPRGLEGSATWADGVVGLAARTRLG